MPQKWLDGRFRLVQAVGMDSVAPCASQMMTERNPSMLHVLSFMCIRFTVPSRKLRDKRSVSIGTNVL